MNLVQKLFAFLLLIIVLPMGISIWLISSNSTRISMNITEAIDRLETKFTADIASSADELIATSSNELDQLTQYNWERLTFHVAGNIADFLYERDGDTRFLATALSAGGDTQQLLDDFRMGHLGRLTVPASYRYDPLQNSWLPEDAPAKESPQQATRLTTANNQENANSFRFSTPKSIELEAAPLYREITVLDLNGQEIAKSSSIDLGLRQITNRQQTYLKAENYFPALGALEEGEIYVSEVIGAYTPTHLIGPYLIPRVEKAGKPFEPEKSAYAGTENPVGKRYEGIIRFATPIFQGGEKTGYVTLALDHRHVMEFTDYIIPENILSAMDADQGRMDFRGNIKDPSKGNYAFMWDNKGRNIAHPREYFISGVDPSTGHRIPGWISADLNAAFQESGQADLGEWLLSQPQYADQSRKKKPNVAQIKQGNIPLDCRYLNFAPQCAGWHQINETGGYGSFLIFWSGIWKLTTAATIPYYSGQYGDSKRGFGFVTIGANIGEFTSGGQAAQKQLKDNIGQVNQTISSEIRDIGNSTRDSLAGFREQMLVIGAIMLVVVVVMASLASINIRVRLSELLRGTTALSKGDLSARVALTGKDEISRISDSFNEMAEALKHSREELETINANLEQMVGQRTDELRESNQQISDSIDYASRIQRSLLPNDDALKDAADALAIVWQPKDVVGGDFYWHRRIGDRDFLVIMDCTGHGVPGAFMTLIATSVLEQIAARASASLDQGKASLSLTAMMQQLHDGVSHQLGQVGGDALSNDGLDAVILSVPVAGDDVHFCGAAMDLYTRDEDGEVERFRGNKVSLGYQHSGRELALTEHVLTADGNTSFIITTDGITTQVGEEIQRGLGYRRFMKIIESAADNTPKMINRAVMRAFRQWQGSQERRDDVTLISLKPAARLKS